MLSPSARVLALAGEPFALIGDGKYHKYTIDWHSGGVKRPDGSVTPGHVDFYVDDIFMVGGSPPPPPTIDPAVQCDFELGSLSCAGRPSVASSRCGTLCWFSCTTALVARRDARAPTMCSSPLAHRASRLACGPILRTLPGTTGMKHGRHLPAIVDLCMAPSGYSVRASEVQCMPRPVLLFLSPLQA